MGFNCMLQESARQKADWTQRQMIALEINESIFKTSISTNEVSMAKLTIE